MSDIKRIEIAEFVSEGYLQELNRLFLHPLGLALEVHVDTNRRPIYLGGVWDFRDDLEGIVYTDGVIDLEKVERIRQLAEGRKPYRLDRLGYWIQPPNAG